MAGGKTVPVLEYSENFTGWSDALTDLHEAAVGDGHPIDVASRQDALAQLSRHVGGKTAPAILEIGCSSGFLLKSIVQCFPSVMVMGADVVRAPLFLLAAELSTVPLLRFDLLQCPLPSEIFDAIVMLNVLEHIEDDAGAIRQLHRLLKPGGVAIVEVPAGPHLYDAYDEALQHFRRYGMKDLVAKFQKAGFVPVRKSHLGCLVYPAFRLAKRRHKGHTMTAEAKNALVRQLAARTASSPLMRLAFALESRIACATPLPWGIRCLLVAQKQVPNG